MDNSGGPFSWLKKRLDKEISPEKKMGKRHYMMIALGLGAAFMLVSNNLFSGGSQGTDIPVASTNKQDAGEVPAFGMKKGSGNKEISDYEKSYEEQLKKALEEMLGVNDVTVVVTLDSTDKKVFEKNRSIKSQNTDETDRDGGMRKVQESSSDDSLVIIKDGQQETPVVVETKKPEIRSVLIVAKGAGNIQIKQMIVEAVTKGLGVPSHRVAVLPKK